MSMQAVIFDMDGVIIDSEPLHARVESEYFRELGLELSQEEHESFLGTSSRTMFSELKDRYGLKLPVEEMIAEERRRYLAALLEAPLPVIPGIPVLVRELAADGFRLAVASSSPREQIDAVLDRSGLGGLMSAKVSGDDVAESKPDPAIFLKAAGELDVPPSSCWVIEDSTNGVAAAVRAGMKVVGYKAPEAPAQDLSAALAVVDSIEDAGRYIRGFTPAEK